VTMSYRDIIRSYSASVERGAFDADLNPRERRLCTVMLNLASNAGMAVVVYPPTDGTREAAVKHLADIIWDARPLVDAVSPASSTAFEVAIERALTILRGI